MVAELAVQTTDSDSPYVNPRTSDFIGALIGAHGNISLAAEKSKVSNSDVIEILNDPAAQQEINGAIRTSTVLKAYEALDDISSILPTMLSGIEPGDAFKAFSTLIQGLAALTAPPKTPTVAIQNNNSFSFDKGDAEVARGKLIDFVTASSTRDTREAELSQS